MAFLAHLLTILFGIVIFVGFKTKRYRDTPFLFFIFLVSFIGFAITSVVAIFVPYGELLIFPLLTMFLGMLLLMAAVNDFRSMLCCTRKIEGTYCGYHTYYGGNGVSSHAPVFEYTFDGKVYHEQTTQNLSYKRLTQKMHEGGTYPIYVDPKHPAIFICSKRLKGITILLLAFGVLFFSFGIVLLWSGLPLFLEL